MMWPAEASALMARAAPGCTDGVVRLALEPGRRMALRMAVRLEGRVYGLGVCGDLPVPVPLPLADPLWQIPLAALLLAPWGQWLASRGLPLPVPLSLGAADAPVPVLAWQVRVATEEGGTRVFQPEGDWPCDWLAGMARHLGETGGAARGPALGLSLAAGWSVVPRSVWSAMRPGDALCLQASAQVEAGRCFLYLEGCRAELEEAAGGWRVMRVEASENMEDRMGGALCVVAEVGRIRMSLAALCRLEAGQLLRGGVPGGAVRLTVSGHLFATGTLMRIGGQLAVRIDALLPEPRHD